MIKIYISGKITGLPEHEYKTNFKIAANAAINKAEVMHNPHRMTINPCNIKPLFGIRKWLFFMINDIRVLRKCTHIATMPNWTTSMGAFIEVFVATFIMKIPVIKLTEKDMKWRNVI